MSEVEARYEVPIQDMNGLVVELEAALRANPEGLLAHFVKTATAVEVKEVAGGAWAEAGNDRISGLREAVQLRLAVDSLGIPLIASSEQ